MTDLTTLGTSELARLQLGELIERIASVKLLREVYVCHGEACGYLKAVMALGALGAAEVATFKRQISAALARANDRAR